MTAAKYKAFDRLTSLSNTRLRSYSTVIGNCQKLPLQTLIVILLPAYRCTEEQCICEKKYQWIWTIYHCVRRLNESAERDE